MEILYLIGMAFMLEKVQLLISMWNYGAVYNGLGAIDGVLKRTGDAPMVYRVLAAWMMVGLQKIGIRKLEAYEIVKVLFIFYALYGIWIVWGMNTVILSVMVLPLTFLYDYWDWSIEIGSIALGMTGNIELALIGAGLLAMSRETFPLVGVGFMLVSLDSLGAAIVLMFGGLIYVSVRMIQGKHKMYCNRFMIKENIQSIKNILNTRVWILSDIVVSLVILAAGFWYCLAGGNGWPVVALIGIAGLTMGRIQETRVFASILPFVLGMF